MVNTRLRARFNEADWADEQMGGVSYLFFLRELAKAVDSDWPAVLAQLEAIRAAAGQPQAHAVQRHPGR